MKDRNDENKTENQGIEGYLDVSKIMLYPSQENGCTYETQPFVKKDGDSVTEIFAAGSSFVWKSSESEREHTIEPQIFQSCMNPADKKICPVHIRRDADGLVFEQKYQSMHIPQEVADQIKILPWTAQVKKKSCHPCRNCGACSW